MADKKVNEGRLVLGFSLFLLVVLTSLSFLPTDFSIGSFQARPIDFLSDIRQADSANSAQTQDDRNDENKVVGSAKPEIRTLPDFLRYTGIINYNISEPQTLPNFSKAVADLQGGKRKKVRIAHIGDSFLEGDIVTIDLRSMLQQRFGGRGIGYVPVTSVIAGFRTNVNHSFSGWKDEHFKNAEDRHQLFLSGHRFASAGNATITYSGTKDSLYSRFNEVYALYNGHNQGNFLVNGKSVPYLNATGIVRQKIADSADMIRIAVSGSQTWYGVSMESDSGVFVDNYNFRGIDGNEYRHIDESWYSAINETSNYDLIILQFGANLLWRPNSTNFKYYEGPMIEAVAKIKRSFPQADILIVTTADKAFRYGGQYQTAKGIAPLLQIQHTIADSTKVHFWNLYEAMGGAGSIQQWVEQKPPLANKDYTHVNFAGGKKLATLLYQAIMNAIDSNSRQDISHVNQQP